MSEEKGDGMPDALAEGGEGAPALEEAGLRSQFAALPYRVLKDGTIEILLITSRTTKRWIIPKGWPMGDRPPHRVAAREAEEEAGVDGRVKKRAIGAYHYNKIAANGSVKPCRVMVFPMAVKKLRSVWPERKQRERRWFSIEDAATHISDGELAPIIRAFVSEER